MQQKRRDYLSYLIRLRRVDNGGQPLWRITVETPGATGGTSAFGNLDALVTFLRTEMEPPPENVEEDECSAK